MASPQKENGYTPVANEILEEIAKIKLNATQLRILLILWRYTYGFSRKEHELSETFISRAIKTNKAHAHKEINNLIKMNIVIVERNSTYSKPRLLSFNKNYERWSATAYQECNNIPGVSEHSESGVPEHTTGGVLQQSQDKQKAILKQYREIYDFYNSLGIVSMKKYTDTMRDAIEIAVKRTGSIDELKQLMDRHREVVEMTKASSYPVRARNLQKFLTQKTSNVKGAPFLFEEYMEGGDKYERYLRDRQPEQPQFTELIEEEVYNS